MISIIINNGETRSDLRPKKRTPERELKLPLFI